MLWTTLRCARHLKIRDVPENGNKGNNETGTKRQKVVSRDAVGSAALARHLKIVNFAPSCFKAIKVKQTV